MLIALFIVLAIAAGAAGGYIYGKSGVEPFKKVAQDTGDKAKDVWSKVRKPKKEPAEETAEEAEDE